MRQITDPTRNRRIAELDSAAFADAPHTPRRMAHPWRWLICAASLTVAMLLALMTGLRAGQGDTRSQQGFYAWLQTDKRHDHAGLSTVVVAGSNRFVFDCGFTEDDPATQNVDAVRALFLTHLDEATTSGFERLLDSPRTNADEEAPLRVWGPRGTREWMRRRPGGHPLAGGSSRRQVTVVDVDEGSIPESDGLTVFAITIDDRHFAYRVAYMGHSVLIATDVTLSPHLLELTRDVDVAIVRHTGERIAAEFLNGVRPRLAVLAQDGVPASAAGIREGYRGRLQIVPPGPSRVDMAIRNTQQARATGGRP